MWCAWCICLEWTHTHTHTPHTNTHTHTHTHTHTDAQGNSWDSRAWLHLSDTRHTKRGKRGRGSMWWRERRVRKRRRRRRSRERRRGGRGNWGSLVFTISQSDFSETCRNHYEALQFASNNVRIYFEPYIAHFCLSSPERPSKMNNCLKPQTSQRHGWRDLTWVSHVCLIVVSQCSATNFLRASESIPCVSVWVCLCVCESSVAICILVHACNSTITCEVPQKNLYKYTEYMCDCVCLCITNNFIQV